MKAKTCSSCGFIGSMFKSKPLLCASCARKTYSTPIGSFNMTKKSLIQQAGEHYTKIDEAQRKIRSIISQSKPPQATKKPKPIQKVSDKEKKRQVAYMALKKEHMKRYPLCQAKLTGCLNLSTDIHHLFMGADRLKYFLDTSTWKTVCRNCHSTIHDTMSNEKLIELGLRLKE